jgi:hypothetical protein
MSSRNVGFFGAAPQATADIIEVDVTVGAPALRAAARPPRQHKIYADQAVNLSFEPCSMA